MYFVFVLRVNVYFFFAMSAEEHYATLVVNIFGSHLINGLHPDVLLSYESKTVLGTLKCLDLWSNLWLMKISCTYVPRIGTLAMIHKCNNSFLISVDCRRQ